MTLVNNLFLQLICIILTGILSELSPPSVRNCDDPNYYGKYCNETMNICTLQQQCYNNGTCHLLNNNPTDFTCACPSGFNGKKCEQDDRLCSPKNCLNGKCTEISNTTFHCECKAGWEDVHCDRKINFCHNITCLNEGTCESLLSNYTCHCAGSNYYGRHCEFQSKDLTKKKRLTITIVCSIVGAIICVALIAFIIKIRKYCLNIVPIEDKPKQIQRNKPKNHIQASEPIDICAHPPKLPKIESTV